MTHALASLEQLTVRRADYRDAADGAAIIALLDGYARGATGTGHPLDDEVCERLVPALGAMAGAFTLLAIDGEGQALGLANCFTTLSTFAARPLVNIHDIVVASGHRGKGIGGALMRAVEAEARARGACKVTLEVLANNDAAKALYTAQGFGAYVLDPKAGPAQFWEKKL